MLCADHRFRFKSSDSGERDFEFDWLLEEDSLIIRCKHLSLLAFCHVLFLKGTDSLTVLSWLIKMCVVSSHMCYSA